MMHSTVANQARVKKEILTESLIKYARINPRIIQDTVKSEDYFFYRNSMKWPVKTLKGKLETGMYKEGSNHLVTIDRCVVHEKRLDKIRKEVMAVLNKYQMRDFYDQAKSGIRHIAIRGFETYQLTIVSGKNIFPEAMVNDLAAIDGIVSIYQNVNLGSGHEIFSNDFRLLYGSKTLGFKVDDLTMRLSPRSFYQLNSKQALNMYQYAISLIDDAELLVEAYCGIGTMSLMALKKVDRVIGIELNNEAIKNAKNNASINHLDENSSFVANDAAKELRHIIDNTKVDVLLVDPPRVGLDDEMLETIIRSNIKQIIYISCNPSTLGKDLEILKEIYHVKSVVPFDMFPQTAKVEAVCLLERK